MKLLLLFSLLFQIMAPVWASSTFVGAEMLAEIVELAPSNDPDPTVYFPDCLLLTNNLDQLWYVPSKMEIEKLPIEGRNLIRIKIPFGRGACKETAYSRYTRSSYKFLPDDAWPFEAKALVKKPLNSLIKAGSKVVLEPSPVGNEDIAQNVTSVIIDRDLLKKELQQSKKGQLKVSYLLNGLYAGFYFDHMKLLTLTYHFELRENDVVWISVTL